MLTACPETDAKVAHKMGLRCLHAEGSIRQECWHDDVGLRYLSRPAFSSDLTLAGEMLVWLRHQRGIVAMDGTEGSWCCECHYAKTPNLALCAAVLAV